MTRSPGALAALVLALSACAAAPEPVAAPSVPERFISRSGPGLVDAPAEGLDEWWARFEDPTLDAVLSRAIAGNLDLKTAFSRLREARALRDGARAARLPLLGFSGDVVRSRPSGETLQGRFIQPETFNLYASGFDASWELDIWGRLAKAQSASEARLEATLEDVRAAAVSLLAEAALSYVELRALQARLALAASNLEVQERTLKVAEDRLKAGLASRLDARRARADLEETRAALPPLRAGARAARNRLAVLTGRAPGELDDVLEKAGPIPVAEAAIAVGVPAGVLRRRPDIRAAERRAAAELATLGSTEAERYPQLALVGNVGLQSIDIGRLLRSSASVFSFGPSLRWTIFDGGRQSARIAAQSERAEQAYLAYRSVVLSALEEVENALAAFLENQLRRASLQRAAAEARRSVALARDQYRQGLVGLQAVLDSQRAQFRLEDQLAQTEAAIAAETIRIYKALGGGWENEDVAALEAAAGLEAEDR